MKYSVIKVITDDVLVVVGFLLMKYLKNEK